VRLARIEWRFRVVLNSELDHSRSRLTRNLRHDTQTEIDTRGNTSCCYQANGIEVEVLQTEAAVERFNELRESMPVGGLFHSTC
jgi:hypothetical protein